jgi:hypothetical protein
VEEEEVVGVEPFDKDDERNVQTAGGGGLPYTLCRIYWRQERDYAVGPCKCARNSGWIDGSSSSRRALDIYMYLSLPDVLFTKVGRGGERSFSSW